mgnify:CR=1 FL=1
MVQAARIAITGTQTMEDGGPQTLELVTDGSYCYEPGFALLSLSLIHISEPTRRS